MSESDKKKVWIGYAAPYEKLEMKLVDDGPDLFQKHFENEEGKMNLKEAKDIIFGKRIKAIEEINCAYSFLEGLNSPDVYEREDIKKLVSSVVQLKLAIQSGCAQIKATTKDVAMIDIADWFLECIDLVEEGLPKESEVKE